MDGPDLGEGTDVGSKGGDEVSGELKNQQDDSQFMECKIKEKGEKGKKPKQCAMILPIRETQGSVKT